MLANAYTFRWQLPIFLLYFSKIPINLSVGIATKLCDLWMFVLFLVHSVYKGNNFSISGQTMIQDFVPEIGYSKDTTLIDIFSGK